MYESDAQQLYHFEHPPLLLVISGTSGAGKDSVVRALFKRMQEKGCPFHFVITANTRPRREDEVDGVDYLFVSVQEFQRMIAQDELLEYAVVYDQYKGVPKQQVREAMASGKDVVMRLDVQGAAVVRELAPEAVLIFLTTSSEEELSRRLQQRHTEPPEQLALRLETAREEMKHIPGFDYVIPNANGKLDETVDAIMSIVVAEKHRAVPRRAHL